MIIGVQQQQKRFVRRNTQQTKHLFCFCYFVGCWFCFVFVCLFIFKQKNFHDYFSINSAVFRFSFKKNTLVLDLYKQAQTSFLGIKSHLIIDQFYVTQNAINTTGTKKQVVSINSTVTTKFITIKLISSGVIIDTICT